MWQKNIKQKKKKEKDIAGGKLWGIDGGREEKEPFSEEQKKKINSF